MALDVDLLILGGGCAGLSLAWRLSELMQACPKTLIIEQRAAYSNDRTWCFFGGSDSRIDGLIAQQWRFLRLSAGDRTVQFDCLPSAYQMLAASAFYSYVNKVLDQCPAMRRLLGTRVTAEPTRTSAGWQIETSHGRVTAKMVVDTRPPCMPEKGLATLWQSFYGQEVWCESEIFDTRCADLMDFTTGLPGQIPFTYVLPISPHRALVEATVFAPDPLLPAELALQFDAALHKYAGRHRVKTMRAESGILPMGLVGKPPSLGLGHVRVGVMAGGARSSSGFAFQRIQHWAEQCCEAIAAGGMPTGHATDPWMHRMMDQLFLNVIASEPDVAPDLFLSMFEKSDSACVIRFLSGRNSLKDCLEIMASLPAKRFIKQLLPQSFSGARAGHLQ